MVRPPIHLRLLQKRTVAVGLIIVVLTVLLVWQIVSPFRPIMNTGNMTSVGLQVTNSLVDWVMMVIEAALLVVFTLSLQAQRREISSGEERFLVERKEKHGLELVFAFEKWLDDEIRFSDNYDSLDLAVMHVSTTLQAKPAHYTTLSGEVIAKERTYGDYAFQHIMTGYPEIFNSWHALTNSANMYADWTKSTFPRIKQDLETTIRHALPKLRLGPLDTEDYCDLDVLLTKFIECKLKYDTLDFLRREPSEFEKALGHQRLYVTAHDNKRRLLMRTHDWMDLRMFQEVTPSIFMDKTIQEELDTISSRLSSIRSNSEIFKVGLRDLVNGLKLGGRLIEGDCANCKDLQTRLLST